MGVRDLGLALVLALGLTLDLSLGPLIGNRSQPELGLGAWIGAGAGSELLEFGPRLDLGLVLGFGLGLSVLFLGLCAAKLVVKAISRVRAWL